MKPNINPKVLATGLFNVAEQNNELESVRDALQLINEVVIASGQFRVFIQSKKIDGKAKAKILNSILGESAHPLVNEILSYISGSSAANELKKTSHLFESMYKNRKNILEVKGVVASEMSDKQIESLKKSLDAILGKKTELLMQVDPNLIGGIKLRIENTFLDASIQNQLQTLRTGLLQI